MTVDGTDRDQPGAGGRVGDDLVVGEGRIVDWERTGRRVRTSAAVIAALVVVVWLVAGVVGDGIRFADLGDWLGLGLGVMVVTEVVVVGGAAVRAERRAAVRGERLGSEDVGLLPPRPGRVRGREPREPARPDDSTDPAV